MHVGKIHGCNCFHSFPQQNVDVGIRRCCSRLHFLPLECPFDVDHDDIAQSAGAEMSVFVMDFFRPRCIWGWMGSVGCRRPRPVCRILVNILHSGQGVQSYSRAGFDGFGHGFQF